MLKLPKANGNEERNSIIMKKGKEVSTERKEKLKSLIETGFANNEGIKITPKMKWHG